MGSGRSLAFWVTTASGIIATVVGSLVVLAITGALDGKGDAKATSKAASVTHDTRVRGSGAETLSGSGTLAGRSFAPQTALVFPGDGGLVLYIYERSYDCATAKSWWSDRGTARLEADLSDDSSGASTLPLGQDLAGVTAGFTLLTRAAHSDSATTPARVRLTRVDTRTRGTWHGQVDVDGNAPTLSQYSFHGTFAARWCGA